jgi:hypothetical protein
MQAKFLLCTFVSAAGWLGCATATTPSGNPDARKQSDARLGPDAMLAIDALVSVEKTVSQNTSDVFDNGAMACAKNTPQRTVANSYYRVFKLSDFSIDGIFHVNKVTFGVQRAVGVTGGKQRGEIKLYNYTGTVGTTLDVTKLISLNSLAIMIDDGVAVKRDVAITADVPAEGTLVVELALPDDTTTTTGPVFFIGSNVAGESKVAYMKATACNVAVPTSIATTIFGGMDIYITATGTTP